MSPTVNNFVHDLVAMAKAMEDLPQVQAELDRTNDQLISALDQVRDREASIQRLKAEIDNLHTNLRQVEEARDEATRAFLEADDRTDKALAFVRSLMGNAQSLIEAVEPPKPEPVPTPVEAQPEGQSVQDPTTAAISPAPVEHSVQDTATQSENATSSGITNQPEPGPAIGTDFYLRGERLDLNEGQRVADPTASSTAGDGHLPANVAPSTAETVADASSQEPQPTAPSEDVGYHNEPRIGHGGTGEWLAWDAWATKMNDKHGPGSWPARS